MPYIQVAKTDLWSTPKKLFDELDGEFHFTLDACATEINTKCERYYSEAQNALLQEWDRSTFCNPPYGRYLINWIHKAWDESRKGNMIVMLLPARTDTQWFHRFCLLQCCEIRWIKGRLHFNDGPDRCPFPSMVVIFHPEKSMAL
jgi:phage N-6-adenine-methyltransferase